MATNDLHHFHLLDQVGHVAVRRVLWNAVKSQVSILKHETIEAFKKFLNGVISACNERLQINSLTNQTLHLN